MINPYKFGVNMTEVIELELSYLASAIPDGVRTSHGQELVDIYFPAEETHPKLRIRKKSGVYELTKKSLVTTDDFGQQTEENIALTKQEFNALALGAGKSLSKTRYVLPYKNANAEIDIFSGPLSGLVIIEFEFGSLAEKNAFEMPSFCLADVTQESFIAGGVLAGKSYSDISDDLDRFNYQTLHI
jgi:CYTH domain-containing protein